MLPNTVYVTLVGIIAHLQVRRMLVAIVSITRCIGVGFHFY
jgi:hypothetical protein